ncbi:flagellar protein FlaG [Saccharospirillum alexandrii]|uniref:flagellar protein FlaG n=1 Tax=Saccharospirillum alexandrii TaxID=2448477 RepID=UPI001FEAABF9|nr:flagellar protein FlaG [Saccharospirillum alexandrii]
MSDFSGYNAALNARPSTPESRSVTAKPQQPQGESGNRLPAEVVKQADGKNALSPVGLYTKAQEDMAGQGPAKASGAEELEQAVATLNDYVQNTERKLNFQLDEDAGLTIIRVYDKQTDELIRQIPNEEAVSLAQKLNEEEPLLLFSAQV